MCFLYECQNLSSLSVYQTFFAMFDMLKQELNINVRFRVALRVTQLISPSSGIYTTGSLINMTPIRGQYIRDSGGIALHHNCVKFLINSMKRILFNLSGYKINLRGALFPTMKENIQISILITILNTNY